MELKGFLLNLKKEILNFPDDLFEEVKVETEDTLTFYKTEYNFPLIEKFLERNADKLDWRKFSEIDEIESFSSSFFEKFEKEFDWNNISARRKISEEFIKEHFENIEWCFLVNSGRGGGLAEPFSEDFIRENFNLFQEYRFTWDFLHTVKVSREFLEDFAFKFSKSEWWLISFYQDLDISFLEKYEDKINWDAFSFKRLIPISVLRKFPDKIHWEIINLNKIVSDELIEEFKEDILKFWKKFNNKKRSLKKEKSENLISDGWVNHEREYENLKLRGRTEPNEDELPLIYKRENYIKDNG